MAPRYYYQPTRKGVYGMPFRNSPGSPCWYDEPELIVEFFAHFEELAALCELTQEEMMGKVTHYIPDEERRAEVRSLRSWNNGFGHYETFKEDILFDVPDYLRRAPSEQALASPYGLDLRDKSHRGNILQDTCTTRLVTPHTDPSTKAAKLYGRLSRMSLTDPDYPTVYWRLYFLRKDWTKELPRPCQPIPYATPPWLLPPEMTIIPEVSTVSEVPTLAPDAIVIDQVPIPSIPSPIVDAVEALGCTRKDFVYSEDVDKATVSTACDEEDLVAHHLILPVPDEPDSTVLSTAVEIVQEMFPVTELTLAPTVCLQDSEDLLIQKEDLIEEEISTLAIQVAAPVPSFTLSHHIPAPVEVTAILQSKVGGGGVVVEQPVALGSPPIDHVSLVSTDRSIPHGNGEQVRSTAIEAIPSTPPVEEDTSPVGKDPPPIPSDSASLPTHHHARKKPYQQKKKARYKILQQKWHTKRKKNAPDKRYRYRLRPDIEALTRTNHEFCTRNASQAPTIPSSVISIPCYEARLNVPSPPFSVIEPTLLLLTPDPIVAHSIPTSPFSHGFGNNTLGSAHAYSEVHRRTHLVSYSPSRSTKTQWSHQNQHENTSLRVAVHTVARTRKGLHRNSTTLTPLSHAVQKCYIRRYCQLSPCHPKSLEADDRVII